MYYYCFFIIVFMFLVIRLDIFSCFSLLLIYLHQFDLLNFPLFCVLYNKLKPSIQGTNLCLLLLLHFFCGFKAYESFVVVCVDIILNFQSFNNPIFFHYIYHVFFQLFLLFHYMSLLHIYLIYLTYIYILNHMHGTFFHYLHHVYYFFLPLLVTQTFYFLPFVHWSSSFLWFWFVAFVPWLHFHHWSCSVLLHIV